MKKLITMKAKRTLTFLLAFVLLLGLAVVPASAASSDFQIKGTRLVKYTGPGGDVVIPDGITEIGSQAFSDCITLTSITIPNGVTTIDICAFFGCTALNSVTIPDGVTSIGYMAFSGCTSLASINIPNSVTEMAPTAFGRCTSLTSVAIPNSVTEICDDTFAYCTNLTSVTIPDGVTTIGSGAFYGCTKLANITIPASVTQIKRMTFYNCRSLTSVTISGATMIGESAFQGCAQLADVTLPEGLTNIGALAFNNTAWQKNMGDFAVVNGILLAYQGKSTSVTIPNTVTTIAPEAFSGCKSLASVIIPDSVTTIKGKAFLKRTSLTSVVIGSGVTKIEDYAFEGCTGLSNVTFSGPVDNIGGLAFTDTPWKRNNGSSKGDFLVAGGTLVSYQGKGGAVVIPDGVTVIGSRAFRNCKTLTAVTLPDSLTEIGDYAFQSTSLTSVTIPKGVTKIGDNAFSSTRLTSVTIPDTVTVIGADAFSSTYLTSITIPGSVTEIGKYAFRATYLTSVTIPGSVSTIGDGAFDSCGNLTNVTISSGVTEIGNSAFRYCAVLKSVSIPNSVARIGNEAFSHCSKLTEAAIPDSVTTIGAHAFSDCASLASITIPSSVTRIGDGAFGSCNKLKTLKILSGEIEFGKNVFSGTNLSASTWKTIYGLMLKQWNNFAACIEPQSERITKLSNQLTVGLTTDYEKAKAICQWVCKNIKYDYHYYYSSDMDWSAVTIEPEEVLDTRVTVCSGYAKLTQALLLAQGIPAQYVTGKANGAKGWEGHAWNEAYADGRWILIDTTWGMNYFDMDVSSFAQKHHPYMRTFIPAEEDVPTTWAKAEVLEAMTAGLIPGSLQAAYRSAITREEFCRLMTTLVEKSTGKDIRSFAASKGLTITDPFTDTDSPEVLAAHALGIANGTSATTFNPKGSIKRQEAAAMLARTGRLLGLTSGKGVNFTDANKFASWAGSEISFVSGLVDPVNSSRVMNGVSTNEFNSQGTYTREQAIVTALRLFHCADK